MATHARITAAAIMALAALLAAGCSSSNGGVSAPSHAASPRAGTADTGSTGSTGSTADAATHASSVAGEEPVPAFVPRHYVTVDPARQDRLIVRATRTGAVVATVSAPHAMAFTAVFGTGTGRVFTVDARPDPATPAGGDALYLLRLDPGTGTPLPLVPVHAGHAVGPGLTAVALSPDASKIAIAYTYRTYPPNRQPLSVYATKTGAVLRTWTVASGIISAADPMADGDLSQAGGNALRWTADGRQLAFAFHASTAPGRQGYGYERAASIRLLDTTAPGSDLIASSQVLSGPGPAYNPGNGAGTQCLVGNGWSLSADGQAVTCAAQWTMPGGQFPAGMRPAHCAIRPATGSAAARQVNLGFWRQYRLPGGGGGADTIYGACPAAAPGAVQLAWASPDGKTVLGAMARPGHPMFGLFRAGAFHELPPPPAGLPLTSIAW